MGGLWKAVKFRYLGDRLLAGRRELFGRGVPRRVILRARLSNRFGLFEVGRIAAAPRR